MSYPNYDDQTTADAAPLRDVVHTADDHAAAEYTAEEAVNLGSQRLRRPEPVDAAEEDIPADADVDDDGYNPEDPYGVGVDEDADDYPEDYWPADHDPYGAADTLNDKAEWGLRGRLNAAFGMSKPPHPDSDEAEYRRNVARIQQSVPGEPLVTLLNTMGREGVTSFALALAYAIAANRNDAPVAVDFNEGGGTLGTRAHTEGQPLVFDGGPYGQVTRQPTIFDLLANGRALTHENAARGLVDQFLRRQPTGVDVLAGDEAGITGNTVGWDEAAAAFTVLRKYRKMVFADTGNNMHASAWEWSVEHADQLVVPMTLRKDSIQKVRDMLGRIYRQKHLRELVSRALVIVTVTPESVPGLEDLLESELERNFGIRELIYFPYEPLFSSGERIVWSHLAHGTRCALVSVAADIVDRLAVRFQHSTGRYGAGPAVSDPQTGPIPVPTGRFEARTGYVSAPPSGTFAAQAPVSGTFAAQAPGSGTFPAQPTPAAPGSARESHEFPVQDNPGPYVEIGGAHRAAGAAWV